jgi:hypothetical protein
MRGATYSNGAPTEHEHEKIKAKKDGLSAQAVAHFGGVESHAVQARKNANNLTRQATNSTELYTLVCASGRAAIFVSDSTIHLVFLAKSREQAGLGTALVEELIVKCRRTFWRNLGTATQLAGRRPRRYQICVTLQECLRSHIHFYKAAGFDVDSGVSGETTSCTYDLSRDSCRILVEQHTYREAMQSIVLPLGRSPWMLRQVEHALKAGPTPRCVLTRVIVDNGRFKSEWESYWKLNGWVVMDPEHAYTLLLNSKKHRQVGVDTEALQGHRGMKNPPAEWGMAMVQLATADAMVIEFVWDEESEKLRPSAQLQKLLQDGGIIKFTWGPEFSDRWPGFAQLRGLTDIQRAKSQVGGQRGNTAPASLVEGLSHACSTLHQDKVCITKESMADRFRQHQNTSVYMMSDCAFLAYAGRDALAVLLAACFMGPDKAGSGQTASLSGRAASTKHQKCKRTGPPREELLKKLKWEHTRAEPVYQTWQRATGAWCATIDFRKLEEQSREGLERFNGKTEKIERDDAKKIVAVDRAAAVALRRLAGEADESPDESTDDEGDDDENDDNEY